MYAKNGKNRWVLFLFLLAGMILGSFLGHYLSSYPYLDWLAFGQRFGLDDPVALSIGILSVTLGFNLQINIAGVIGMGLGFLAYRLSGR